MIAGLPSFVPVAFDLFGVKSWEEPIKKGSTNEATTKSYNERK